MARRSGMVDSGVPRRRVSMTVFWDTFGDLRTALWDSDMFGLDNRRCDDFVLGL